jgi:predicted SnoaL-like aldol condensation-catalyzing enzyme
MENHLHVAQVHHKLGNKRSTFLALLYWAMSDDIYGEHWDKVQEKRNETIES